MNMNLTELVFIVDRSGSMAGLESDTIGGLNSTLAAHKEAEGEAVVSTVLFNHKTRVLHDRIDIREVEPLAKADYQASGCTSLLDAVGGAISHIEMVQRYLPQEYRPAKTIFVITTDGLENSSTKYSYEQVKQMITDKTEAGWQFIFLGANIDAAAEASAIGIDASHAATYMSDSYGTEIMFDAICESTLGLREMGCAELDANWKDAIDEDFAKRG